MNVRVLHYRRDLLEPRFDSLNTGGHILVKQDSEVRLFGLDFTRVDPTSCLRVPAKIGRVDVQDACPADSSWSRCPEMTDLEEKPHGRSQSDAFVTGQS